MHITKMSVAIPMRVPLNNVFEASPEAGRTVAKYSGVVVKLPFNPDGQ